MTNGNASDAPASASVPRRPRKKPSNVIMPTKASRLRTLGADNQSKVGRIGPSSSNLVRAAPGNCPGLVAARAAGTIVADGDGGEIVMRDICYLMHDTSVPYVRYICFIRTQNTGVSSNDMVASSLIRYRGMRWVLVHQLPAWPAYPRGTVWRRLRVPSSVTMKGAVHARPREFLRDRERGVRTRGGVENSIVTRARGNRRRYAMHRGRRGCQDRRGHQSGDLASAPIRRPVRSPPRPHARRCKATLHTATGSNCRG